MSLFGVARGYLLFQETTRPLQGVIDLTAAILPVFMFAFYLLGVKFPKGFLWLLPSMLVLNAVGVAAMMMAGWAWHNTFTWSALFWLLNLVLFYRGVEFSTRIYTCAFAVLAASTVWEMPIHFGVVMLGKIWADQAVSLVFNLAYPLVFSSKILCLPFYILGLRSAGWHATRNSKLVLVGYVLFCLALFTDMWFTLSGINIDPVQYVIRIPTVAFFTLFAYYGFHVKPFKSGS